MLKSEIKPGTEYAFREHRNERAPFHRIRILQHTRGTKWRAEWIEPSPGLVDYVESGQLVVTLGCRIERPHFAIRAKEQHLTPTRMRHLCVRTVIVRLK